MYLAPDAAVEHRLIDHLLRLRLRLLFLCYNLSECGLIQGEILKVKVANLGKLLDHASAHYLAVRALIAACSSSRCRCRGFCRSAGGLAHLRIEQYEAVTVGGCIGGNKWVLSRESEREREREREREGAGGSHSIRE